MDIRDKSRGHFKRRGINPAGIPASDMSPERYAKYLWGCHSKEMQKFAGKRDVM